MNQNRHPRGERNPQVNPQFPQNLRDWDTETMLKTAEHLANSLRRNLDTQLRRIFDSVKRLEMELQHHKVLSKDQILMLKPRLAYTVARTEDLRPLYNVISQALHRIHTPDDFNKLVAFLEAVLAYYKFYHPR